ncbi:pyridoxal phosphate-dependent aminotransferase [Natrarchaeobius oligotrophus]|uniref:Aminotransferase n=1 Tax=Natrarchaeobius chitinivorans TaxID=1679083 RepID=A0A3N6NJX4_NATCH|nr:pyridoxal phosphate-dependent aminotransferase [Natrarchaeobius chitinivorans]RQG99452.1 pyridoxal phosphate-dependent aminotransferase [Natrarchaeobius chitinivorans]
MAGPPLADRATGFEGSQIRVMFDLANESDSDDLVRLEIGEPDFHTPEHVVEAAYEAAMAGETHYTSTLGLPELRVAIAEKLERENGVSVDPASELLITMGGIEAVYLALLVSANRGDRVLIPEPRWPNYEMQAELIGATPVRVPLSGDDGFALDPDRLIEEIDDDTGAIVLTTPSNPTGRVYDADAVRAVTEAAADHDAFVISDAIYERLVFDEAAQTVAAATDSPANVIEVNSFSKGYAMTGWRIGWLAAKPEVVSAAQQLRQCLSLCPNTISQYAAIAALTGPQEPFDEMRDAYAERRDVVVDRIADIPELSCARPEGAFYAMVDATALERPSLEMSKELLTEHDVVTTPGSAFGPAANGYIRLSFANSIERLETGFDRIESYVRSRR